MSEVNLAERVFEAVLRHMVSGRWKPGGRLPPTRQLSAELGVSHVTLQSALRRASHEELVTVRQRRPTTVREGAIERARQLLEQVARKPSARRIALLHPDTMPQIDSPNYYWGEVAAALQRAAAEHEFSAEVVTWPLDRQVDFTQRLPETFGGAIAMAARADYVASLIELARVKFPLILHNRRIQGANLPMVRLDEHAAAYRLGEVLAERGHRNMCMVTIMGYRAIRGGPGRNDGWLDFLVESGLIAGCNVPIYAVPRREDFRHHLGRLAWPGGPTALVFGSGFLTDTYLRDPYYANLRVPEDISMATFDNPDNLPATPGRPQLTNVQFDQDKAAQEAVALLENVLAGRDHATEVVVPLEVRVTESIAPPPAK